jgi:hypothetical protein
MPLDIPPGNAQIIHSLTLTGDAERMAITYGVDLAVEAPPNPNAIAASLHNVFFQNMGNILATGYQLVATEMRYSVTGETFPRIARHEEVNPGTGSSNLIPQNTAYLIHKVTAFGGRRNKGRFYLPGVGEPDVSILGALTTAEKTRIQNALNAWFVALNAIANIDDVVILHSSGITPTPAPTAVVGFLIDPVVATQRRRLR